MSAGAPASGLVRSGAASGTTSCSSALTNFGSSQCRLPIADGVLGAGEQLELAVEGLGLGAAVEAEDRAPLAGRLVAQALGVAYSGQRHAGDEQEDSGQAIESGGQAEQAVGGAEQALAEQHRQCREDAAVGDAVAGLANTGAASVIKPGLARVRPSTARRAAHGRVLVAGVAAGAIGGRSRVGLRSTGVGGVIGVIGAFWRLLGEPISVPCQKV